MKTLRIPVICLLLLGMPFWAGCSEEGPTTPNSTAELSFNGDLEQESLDGIDAAEKCNNGRRIRLEVQNTIEIVPPFDDPTIIHAIFDGEGRARPFGPFELHSTSVIDASTYPLGQTADYVFTFRNGDELHASSAGTAIEDPPGYPIFSGELTFTGGTGRFSDVTGSGTYAGTADTFAGTGQFDIDGRIFGFGGRGH